MMLKRLLLAALALSLCAPLGALDNVLPSPKGTVSDYTDTISLATEERVKTLADELRSITSVNIKVAVFRTVGSFEVEQFGRLLYDQWDVGEHEQGLDHGVLILISIVERQVKIIAGKGVDFILTPPVRQKIEFNVLAMLFRGDFNGGTEVGAETVSRLIIADWPTEDGRRSFDWHYASLPFFMLFIVSALLAIIFGGDFFMAFGIFVGGVFGYMFGGLPIMVIFTVVAFFLFYEGGLYHR